MGFFDKFLKKEEKCSCGSTNEQTTEGKSSCCEGNCDCNSSTGDEALTIKVLGSGCKNCVTLAENIKAALEQMQLSAKLVKVTDIADIAAYGVMSTPAMVVNEKVVSFGKVLKTDEVIKVLEKVQF